MGGRRDPTHVVGQDQYDALMEPAADNRLCDAAAPLVGILWRVKTQHASQIFLNRSR
jgi:type VI protein secretion system component VasF